MRALTVLVVGFLLSACAQEQALYRVTSSGYPEETYENTNVEAIKARIMDGCMARGSLIQEAGPNHVLCGRTMTGGDAVLAQLLIGNSYSTTPEMRARFVLFQAGTSVRVSVQQWVETQMAFGQMRRTDLNSNAARNSMQAFLAGLSPPLAAAPASTSAPPVVATSPSRSETQSATTRPAAEATGQDAGNAERLARQQSCNADPRAALAGKGPGFEAYTVACTNGDTLFIRCEFGNCRALR